MKSAKRIASLWIGLIAALVSLSCDEFYFDDPQPVNAKNSYEFPADFRGVWKDNGTLLTVEENRFSTIEFHDRKLPMTLIDTSDRYVIKEGKIYPGDRSKETGAAIGFPFTVQNDTLYFQETEELEMTLGRNFFLRKGDGYYVLNSEKTQDWWELFLIELKDERTLLVRYLNKDDLDALPGLTFVHSNNNQHFLEARWKTKEMTGIIERGAFSDTLMLLKRTYK